MTDAYWYEFVSGRDLARHGKIKTLKKMMATRWQAEDIHFPIRITESKDESQSNRPKHYRRP
jgi:hypothetical protein